MAKLDVAQWRMDPDVARAQYQGFNYIKNLARLVCKEFPFFNDWEFGFFTKEDLPMRHADGWEPLRVSDLPDGDGFRQRFNEAIAAHRFSLRKEADGTLWYRDLCVCVMPKEYRKQLIEFRANQEARRQKDQKAAKDGSMAVTRLRVRLTRQSRKAGSGDVTRRLRNAARSDYGGKPEVAIEADKGGRRATP